MSRIGFIMVAASALAVLACTLVAVAQEGTPKQASSPTPTAMESPTPTPSATQFLPQSTVTVRFVQGGQPVRIILSQPLEHLLADGLGCSLPITAEVVLSPGFSIRWPLAPAIGRPAECVEGPPTVLRFEFRRYDPVLNKDLGVIFTEFVWTGGDITVDLEIPLDSTPTPIATTPSPPPAATAAPAPASQPAGLPRTGGRQPPAGAGPLEAPAALAAWAVLGGLATVGTLRKRGR